MALLRRIWGGRGHRTPSTVEAFQRAERYRRTGHYAEAVELVTYGLTLEPNNVTGHMLAGYLHHAARTLDAARDEFRWVLERDPHHPRALLGLARLALEEGNLVGCHDLLARALRDYPDFPEAKALLDGVATAPPPAPAPARAAVHFERLRLPSAGRALLIARHDGTVLTARPGGPQDSETSGRLAQVLRLGAATLARAGCGPLHRAVLEDDADALFVRTDGTLFVSLAVPRTLDVTQGLLEVNRLWAGALHELGLASATASAPPASAPAATTDSNRRAS
jgi:tetratricopeptide (TPR) repeat protein